MKVLNLSNNRLSELPYAYVERPTTSSSRNDRQDASRARNSLEKLYLTGNSLTNTALDALAKFKALRLLHLAYNALDTLPER
jgi:Leucine-rich repeat (LRR) protein